VQYEKDRLYQSIIEKQDQLESKVTSVKQKRVKEIRLRAERESLKALD
jgi:hypothetical protein